MRRPTTALIVLSVVLLAACGDGGDATTTSGPGIDAVPRDVLDVEVLALGEGEPPGPGGRGPLVLDPADPEAAAALFVEGERAAVEEAVEDVDLDGRILLGGIVHEGCFPAEDPVVAVVEGEVGLDADRWDPREDEVECVRAVITAAVLAVDPDDLPDGFDAEPDGGEPAPDPSAGEVPGEVVLLEPGRYEAYDAPGPGLVRDPVDLEAVLGRYGFDEPDQDLLDRVGTGAEVLVAVRVGGSCELPVEVALRRDGAALQVVESYDEDEPERVCDEAVQGLALVAVDAAEVEDVETVEGAPADGPTGVGVTRAVEPLDPGVEPSAVPFDDFADDPFAYPGLDGLDLPAVEDGAVRLVFVVEACQPDTAELVADLDAGTVRAKAQQAGDRVDCDALAPHLVVADLAAVHADLDPVVG